MPSSGPYSTSPSPPLKRIGGLCTPCRPGRVLGHQLRPDRDGVHGRGDEHRGVAHREPEVPLLGGVVEQILHILVGHRIGDVRGRLQVQRPRSTSPSSRRPQRGAPCPRLSPSPPQPWRRCSRPPLSCLRLIPLKYGWLLPISGPGSPLVSLRSGERVRIAACSLSASAATER